MNRSRRSNGSELKTRLEGRSGQNSSLAPKGMDPQRAGKDFFLPQKAGPKQKSLERQVAIAIFLPANCGSFLGEAPGNKNHPATWRASISLAPKGMDQSTDSVFSSSAFRGSSRDKGIDRSTKVQERSHDIGDRRSRIGDLLPKNGGGSLVNTPI